MQPSVEKYNIANEISGNIVTNKRPIITLIITQTYLDAEHTKKTEKL